ncbi:secreted pectate lyase [Gracilibacillus halophilus YIM-C55.5]|uniref:Pectate lyase n=2 Tax=Gracilibacillus TaxID=74385 RepID=N4WAN9_9BACI|nr:secreted pectate lyase [Gracilibacillus halophilus YIM-C55.5]
MKRKLLMLIPFCLLFTIVFVSENTQAANYDDSKTYKLVNRNSGKALEVYEWSNADGGNIVQYDDLGGMNQQWRIVDVGEGHHKFLNIHSGKAMEVTNWSTDNGASVTQWTDWNGESQQWEIVDLGNGYVKIINRYSGKALEVFEWSTDNGANIVQWDDLGGENQQWQIIEVSPSDTIQVNQTIVVEEGDTFDGEGRRYVANPDTVGDGSQDEGQDPVFRLEDGATLRNVVLGYPAADGVHTYGDALVENVVWENIGEDALTIKDNGHVTVRGGMAQNGDDKMFQVNAPSTFEILNFTAKNAGKMIRQNGGTTFQTSIFIEGSVITDMDEAIFRTDSNSSGVTMTNTRYSNVGTKWYNVQNVTENGNYEF